MTGFAGTLALTRLALRLDRIRLPIWLLALATMAAASAGSIADLYPTESDRLGYATTTAVNVVARAFNGTLSSPSLGAIVMVEIFTFLSLFAALLSTQTVVRHTRLEEETGRAEMIGSSVVGRFASLTAALLVMAGTNLALAALIALALVANGLAVTGSLAAGAAIGTAGMAFGALAAVAAQVMEGSRAANGTAATIIGAAFLLRATGDALGDVADNGTEVTSAWPAWLSPFGWAVQARPFSDERWAAFVPLGLLIVAAVVGASLLSGRRDVGSGLLRTSRGPAAAPRSLRNPLGLAWRLQRGVLIGWSVAVIVLSVSYGAVANEINTVVGDNEQMRELMNQLGGSENLVKGYLAFIMVIFGLVVSGYAVQSLQRLRGEEAGGPLESVLATAVSRPAWLGSHLTCALLGATWLLALSGAGAGLAYGLIVDDPAYQTATMLRAGLVQLPAVAVIVGFAVAAFGLVPQRSIALAWSAFAVSVVVVYLGPLLDLPQWTMDISPFTHLPAVPVDAITAKPLLVLSAVGVALGVIGFAAFRRRDLRL
ncbi:MAG: anibiotic ABC transporter [Dactylosporangium sp.]|nr:anibiotic ABC transporter [Dactylosporangium sp.]NNJ63768.1 anibiotic ABC transporter [Dactylosporangium sp.]